MSTTSTLGHLVKLEVSIHRPWVNVGPDVIMREAPLRLQNGQSWDKLRPSLAITVRLEVLGPSSYSLILQ